MTREIRQTVTITIDLVQIGDGEPEANEITITTADGRSKGYGPRDLEQAMKRGSYRSVDTDKLFAACETLAVWAAPADEWESV